MPVFFIFRVLVSPLSLLIVLSSGCAKAKLEPEEAKKRFLAIAKNGCDGDVREMHDVLHATFKKGALVSDYKDILNTAHLKITDPTQLANHATDESREADVLFIWNINDGSDGILLRIFLRKSNLRHAAYTLGQVAATEPQLIHL